MGGHPGEPDDPLVIYTGAERGSEESFNGRGAETGDPGLFLPGGYGGADAGGLEGKVSC